MRTRLLLLVAAALALTPAAAQQVRYLDPRDVAQAQRENAQVIQELGGAETGPRAAYVDSVGRRVAAFSGIASPGQVLHFTTLNSAVENAFSVPGGYVYITRQLMTLMGDESQLAFALGHEVGHIAADHAHQREEVERELSWQALPYIMMGQMMGGYANQIALRNLLAVKLQTLSFSREQEYEADTLGLRYMIQAGYDPAGAAQLLASLARETALQARVQGRTNRQIPEWASTHPLSENRMQRALDEARQTGRLGTGLHNRDAFLSELEGIYVDDDPAQGIIDGPVFTHPDLRIQFKVPTGKLVIDSKLTARLRDSFFLESLIPQYADNLKSLRGFKFDWSRNDGIWDHVFSNHALTHKLNEFGVVHEAEEYNGLWDADTYWSAEGRVMTDVLPFFQQHLES